MPRTVISLESIQLDNNHLSGNWTYYDLWTYLWTLAIGQYSGRCRIRELSLISVRNNAIEGPLPPTVSAMPLKELDVGENRCAAQQLQFH